MNKIFKSIWNRRRGMFVAVSEALGVGQSKKKAVLIGATFLLGAGSAQAAYNLTVNADESKVISNQDLTVANSNEKGSIINWGNLSIKGGGLILTKPGPLASASTPRVPVVRARLLTLVAAHCP